MADEPGRRTSTRANKGHHTKQNLPEAPPAPKRKGGKRGKKNNAIEEDEGPAEIIRCVCGKHNEYDDDDEEVDWISCDVCNAWQHPLCMGIPPFEGDIPENYYCEQCRPENHQELLESMKKKGSELWRTRRKEFKARQAAKNQEEAESKSGKGKRGRKAGGKRKSDPELDTKALANGHAAAASPPPPGTKEPPVDVAGTKRKAEPVEPADKPDVKVRRMSEAQAATSAPDTEVPKTPKRIVDLQQTLQKAATGLKKSVLPTVEKALQDGVYEPVKNEVPAKKAEELAIHIVTALYRSFDGNQGSAFAGQLRSLLHNLKSNTELCMGLLSGTLTYEKLVTMSSDEMASTELKEKLARMQVLADKQAMLVPDDGPQIRRTHKGEEVVEGTAKVADEIPTLAARRRSTFDANEDMVDRSRENSVGSGEATEPPDIVHARLVTDAPPRNAEILSPSSTKSNDASPVADTTFDIKKVLDKVNVQSPVVGISAAAFPRELPRHAAGSSIVDHDIDKMLQDDKVTQDDDEPPYSPKLEGPAGELWRGRVVMDGVANFSATAHHIGGAELRSDSSYETLVQKDLRVAGRIDHVKANEYLCSMRYSSPTDVVLLALTPQGHDGAEALNKLFTYFQERHRYGVLQHKGSTEVRDTYLVPIEPSPKPLPDFVDNLEGHKVPKDRAHPMLLVTMVVRHPERPMVNSTSPGQLDQTTQQRLANDVQHAMSPVAPQGQPSQYQPPSGQARQQGGAHHDDNQARLQREGEMHAARILGPNINAPTVAFLLPQAFQMRPLEWEIIRDILISDPRARDDLAILSSKINEPRSANGGTAPA